MTEKSETDVTVCPICHSNQAVIDRLGGIHPCGSCQGGLDAVQTDKLDPNLVEKIKSNPALAAKLAELEAQRAAAIEADKNKN